MTLIFKKSTAQPNFDVAATISGTLEATQELTCAWTVVRARDRNVTCRWYRHTADDGTDPTGVLLGTGSTYTLTGTDVGNYIRAIVTAINPAGTVASTTAYTAIITSGDPPEPPALVTPAAITISTVAEVLTAEVTYGFTGQSSVAIQWYSYATESKSDPVQLGTSSTQDLTGIASDRWIGVTVTATNAVDDTETSAIVPLEDADPYAPIPPEQYIVPAYDSVGMEMIYCNAGDDLQAKINQLRPGKCLVIQAGATFTGKFRVPRTYLDAVDNTPNSIESTGTAATVTTALPHGLSVGEYVIISGCTEAEYNGRFPVESVGETTFTYTMTGDPADVATGAAIRWSKDWAYIVTSGMNGLPAEGQRVSADDVAYMPTVRNTTTFLSANAVTGITYSNTTQATITYASTSAPSAYSKMTLSGANEPEWNSEFLVLSGTSTQATLSVPSDLPSPTGSLTWKRKFPQSFVLGVDDGVNKLRVVGLEITTTYDEWSYTQSHLVFAGKSAQDELTTSYYGENIVFDRCYIHANRDSKSQCGILLYGGCAKVAVIGCDIEWFHGTSDANGVWLWQTPGKVLIHNNRIVTSGENVFLSGNSATGTTFNSNRIPRDVVITKNYIAGRTEYIKTHPDYAYPGRTIITKNLIESKGSKRVLVQGNVFYLGRGDGSQQGCPWMHQNVGGDGVWDVDFRDNLAVDCGSITLANPFSYGRPWGYQRLRFFNNLFYNPYSLWSSVYVGTNIVDDACGYITFKNNTWVYPGNPPNAILFFAQTPTESARITGLVFEDNIIREGRNAGIGASGGANGRPAPLFHCPGGFDFNNNVVVGGQAAQYGTQYDDWRNWSRPSGNSLVGYVDDTFNELADFALSVGSPYKGAALDGASDIGADISAIQAQINASDNPFGA